MAIYFILFVYLLLVLIIDNGKNNKKIFWSAFSFIFLIIALRSQNVGTDTITYVKCWHHPNFFYSGMPTDKGFEFFLRILHSFGSSTGYFLIVSSLLPMLGVLCLINNYSKYKIDSLFFFSCSGTIFVFMLLYLNAMRQVNAMGLVMIGLYFFYKQDRFCWRYFVLSLLCFVLAISIHGSSAIVIPFLFVNKFLKLSKHIVIIAIVVTYIVGATGVFHLSDMFSLINLGNSDFSKYQGYTETMTFGAAESFGIINMFSLPFSLIMIYITVFQDKAVLENWMYKWLFVGIILLNLLIDNLMWGRLTMYFTILSIVVFPNYLRTIRFKYKNIIYGAVIFFFLRKVVIVIMGAQLHSALFNINTEVPYETWLSW